MFEKSNLFAALMGSLTFVLILIVIDYFSNPNNFSDSNYWIRRGFAFICMFVVYLIFYRGRNISWRQLFKRKK